MTDAEKIELLRAKLEETLSENDRLRAELTRMIEGATARDTLSSIHRNPELPPAIRTKAAIGCLPYESSPLQSTPPPLDLPCEEIEPLATLVEKRRARQRELEPPHRVLPNHQIVFLKPNGDGSGDEHS